MSVILAGPTEKQILIYTQVVTIPLSCGSMIVHTASQIWNDAQDSNNIHHVLKRRKKNSPQSGVHSLLFHITHNLRIICFWIFMKHSLGIKVSILSLKFQFHNGKEGFNVIGISNHDNCIGGTIVYFKLDVVMNDLITSSNYH